MYIFHNRRQKKIDGISESFQCSTAKYWTDDTLCDSFLCPKVLCYVSRKKGGKKKHLKCIDGFDGGQEYDHQKCKNDVTTCLYCNFF